ncbi:unnamed protein product [Tilletia laevis]|uniref:JmjC domain-containing protein n=3 Tax=Tilletia TaxID=13289 RepID=A0A8X7SZK7_9BASI|nr:hypothetical protein CF336_g3105 [Tilletia laevis]KAE8197305.1 hypothetical protein CF328_g3888 [Tilletia controversa]KAE8261147.1 hypothetical protein A4X03_0g3501 [Tilletia caries]KAE8202613.1 hypothetical protein CF335_g3349 [Tilletia laevis]KAE8253166.1 hypothetical protein A4X06_0g1650 [Tilletia controversa]
MRNDGRATKRVRIEGGSSSGSSPGGISIGHPLRLKPLGNAYFSSLPNARIRGLGQLQAFSDEQIGTILSHILEDEQSIAGPPSTLARLAQVSHALNVFATQDSLWRDAFLLRRDFHATLQCWAGSWRRTYALHHLHSLSSTAASLSSAAWLTLPQEPVTTPDLFSDHLFHTFVHALTPLQPLLLSHSRRDHLQANPIPRISARTYTIAQFTEQFAIPNQPCIMTDEPGLQPSDTSEQRWPCADWTLDSLAEQWPDRIFRAEAIKCSARTYLAYARSCGAHALRAKGESVPIAYFPPPATVPISSQSARVGAFDPYVVPDESTSYLFDASFPSTDPVARAAWRVPRLLSETTSASRTEIDLFSLLGPHHRPDYRWLIAGPERSGSSWHLDPNGTSAWNTVLSGSKLWLMLPPHCPPPGVYVTEDEGEVTSPASLAEWVSLFARATYEVHGTGKAGDGKLLVGVCRAGETCYVPSGWWHAVLNLEECVALTQNFVSPTELPYVLHFLKHKPDQISGFKRPRPSGNGSDPDTFADADADDDETSADAAAAGSTGPHHQQQLSDRLETSQAEHQPERDFRWDVFDTFCARLGEFDPALLERGLEGMRTLEAERQLMREEAMGLGAGMGSMGRKRHVEGGEGRSTWWEKLKGKTAGESEEGVENGVNGHAGLSSTVFSLGGAVDEDELGEVPW